MMMYHFYLFLKNNIHIKKVIQTIPMVILIMSQVFLPLKLTNLMVQAKALSTKQNISQLPFLIA